MGDGTWIPVSTGSAACLHLLLLKEEKVTLTLVLFIPQELMEGSREPGTGHIGGTEPLGSSPLGTKWELVF